MKALLKVRQNGREFYVIATSNDSQDELHVSLDKQTVIEPKELSYGLTIIKDKKISDCTLGYVDTLKNGSHVMWSFIKTVQTKAGYVHMFRKETVFISEIIYKFY